MLSVTGRRKQDQRGELEEGWGSLGLEIQLKLAIAVAAGEWMEKYSACAWTLLICCHRYLQSWKPETWHPGCPASAAFLTQFPFAFFGFSQASFPCS